MFGSKNKNPKSQIEVSVETMEGNLKGEGGKATMIEYEKTNSPQDSSKEVTPPPASGTNPATIKEPTENNIGDKKAPFKSPFEGGDLPIGKAGSAGTIGQGTFPPPAGNSATEGLKSIPKTIDPPKKDDAAFLHQAVDGKIDNKDVSSIKQVEKMPSKKKGGMNSFLLIVLFIALLAVVLFGGYYFYMNKDSNVSKVEENTKPVKPAENPANKPAIPVKEIVQKKEIAQKEETTPKIEKLVTSVETFNGDLSKFILDLKQRRSPTDLQNGIFINPTTATEGIFPSSDLIKALHLSTFFDQADLKDSCKLFAIEDNGEIRVAVVFELTEIADEKLVKDRIMKGEKDLLIKMSYLFVDGSKPTVPAEITFAVNDINMGARYMNYTPALDTSSVDWNILDLGKGKLVYFATSRKTAKVLTDYFMRSVMK